MNRVAAPKKAVSEATRAKLVAARVNAERAQAELWSACDAALREGTYDEVAVLAGVARSTLQEKVRQLRAG